MRPKRNVLLYCMIPAAAGIMRFVIENRMHLRVDVAHTREDVQEYLAQHPPGYFEAAMVVRGVGEHEALGVCSDLRAASVPTILLRQAGGPIEEREACADVCLTSNAGVAEWMERLRILTARKRGPKKALRAVVAPVGESLGRAA